jgi:hypothetical protein
LTTVLTSKLDWHPRQRTDLRKELTLPEREISDERQRAMFRDRHAQIVAVGTAVVKSPGGIF